MFFHLYNIYSSIYFCKNLNHCHTCSFAHSSTGLAENWWNFLSGGDWLTELAALLDDSSAGRSGWGRARPEGPWKDRRYSGGIMPASVGSENV
jgi:hypothetical protein